jgi:hypothetical protein
VTERAFLDEPVTITVTCRTSRSAGKGSTRRHPVTVRPDGTVDTGHDVDSERILAAMGGYLSCLDFVDRVVPAFRELLQLRHRRAPFPITADRAGGPWNCVDAGTCCRRGFRDAREAAEHARDPQHVAKLRGANQSQMRALAKAAAVPVPVLPTEQHARLWERGVHPEHVDSIAARVGATRELPDEFYLGAMCRQPDMDWLAATLRAAGCDATTSVWLAWTYQEMDRRDPGGREKWLRGGMMPSLVIPMMRSPYDVDDVKTFAQHWRISFFGAAFELVKWCNCGLAPAVDELVGRRTDHLAFPPQPPSPQARQRVRDMLDARFSGTSDMDIALALVEFGNAGRATRALEWGMA